MMQRTAVLLAILTCSCGHSVSVQDAIDGAEKTLVGVDVGITLSKEAVDEATTRRMQQCAGETGYDARKACMGKLGEPVAPAFDKAAAAYDAAVAALELLEEANRELQPFVEAAREELGR